MKDMYIRKASFALYLERYMLRATSKRFHARTESTAWRDHDTFYGSRTGDFTQEQPTLRNQYTDDPVLSSYLKRSFPAQMMHDIEEDLMRFGGRVSDDVLRHHNNVGNHNPTLQQYDGWGRRIDSINYHPSWRELHDIAAAEKLISIPYENKYGSWSRLYQCVKLFLFNPSSGLYSCPLAMTDGAASILQSLTTDPFAAAYNRLISNDPELFWTSGQWMTEKKGGSDVGNGTDTYAVRQMDGSFRLYGYKWFTSAVDADMALTLARIADDDSGKVVEGTGGLTMFYLETRQNDGSFNGLKVEKLKNKLGTRQMPTAELILEGTKAFKLSEEGRGIASISPMLTVTRMHNAISATSMIRRLLNLSKDFATKRKAFGKRLMDNTLHVQTLARMEVEQRAAFYFLMRVCYLFGRVENLEATDYEKLLLRILMPLLKLYTGKQVVTVASELLESFGGHGYLEDTGLPVYLRDAQVLSIWEGTTNVLSMDVLRSITNTNGEVLKVFLQDCQSSVTSQTNIVELQKCGDVIGRSVEELQQFIDKFVGSGDGLSLKMAARDFSYSLSRVYMASLLYRNAVDDSTDHDAIQVAYRWTCFQDLVPVTRFREGNLYSTDSIAQEKSIVYPDER